MKRIGKSKEPSEQQIKNMLSNLHEKFPEASFCIDMDTWHHANNDLEFHYALTKIEPKLDYKCIRLIKKATWPEIFAAYRKEMFIASMISKAPLIKETIS